MSMLRQLKCRLFFENKPVNFNIDTGAAVTVVNDEQFLIASDGNLSHIVLCSDAF